MGYYLVETGTIPIIAGGDHSLMSPDVVAMAEVNGTINVGVIHFDAPVDAEEGGFRYLFSG
jgi:arginase family enzyme